MSGELIDAVQAGSLERTCQLLAEGADPNSKLGRRHVLDLTSDKKIIAALVEAGGWIKGLRNALGWAAESGRPALVRAMIDRGADVNFLTHSGSPLQYAATGNNLEIVDLLLKAGADPDRGTVLATPLTVALDWGNVDLAVRMLEGGADPNLTPRMGGRTPLGLAVEKSQTRLVEQLLAHGAEPSTPTRDSASGHGTTPLLLAASRGDSAIVELLLDAGASLEAVDHQGRSVFDCATGEVASLLAARGVSPAPDPTRSLLEAARHGQLAKVRELLALGASVEGPETQRFTPLMLAARGGHEGVVGELIQAGAQVDAGAAGLVRDELLDFGPGTLREMEERLGRTALMLAIDAGHTAVAERLVNSGASLELTDAAGRTPLALACELGHRSLAQRLLEAGARIPPLAVGLAQRQGHNEVARWLLEQGARPEPGGLHAACTCADVELVRAFLQAGADPGETLPGQGTPLGLAVQSPHPTSRVCQVVELLLATGKISPEAAGGRLSPLASAVAQGRTEIVHLLLQAGADPRSVEPPATGDRKPKGMRRPKFAKAAESARFQRTLKTLRERFGGEPQPFRGGFRFRVDKADDLAALQREYPEVVIFEPSPGCLAVLPTDDPYQALAVMQTRAVNYDLGPGDIVEWLQQLEPFALLGATEDSVKGAFYSPPTDPAGLARRFYAFCPDLVDQGTGTLERLAEHLAKGSFQLWWD